MFMCMTVSDNTQVYLFLFVYRRLLLGGLLGDATGQRTGDPIKGVQLGKANVRGGLLNAEGVGALCESEVDIGVDFLAEVAPAQGLTILVVP